MRIRHTLLSSALTSLLLFNFGVAYAPYSSLNSKEVIELDNYGYRNIKTFIKISKFREFPKEEIVEEEPKQLSSRSKEKIMVLEATAYGKDCIGCKGITSTGIDIRNSTPRIVATDPRVIPLGSILIIDGKEYIAADTGGRIKGNKIDVLVKSEKEAEKFGRKIITVKVIVK